MNNTYVKQKLDELHLIDDFLFFQMMNHPKYGPKFSRLLLKLILGRDVGKLHVIPQKEYYGENTDLHGARLDVYLEEEEPDLSLIHILGRYRRIHTPIRQNHALKRIFILPVLSDVFHNPHKFIPFQISFPNEIIP